MSTTSSTGGSVGIATELELRFHQELYEAAPGDTRRAMDWRCEEVDGALVSMARGTPSILFNRTLGLGVRRPANRETVERILQVYAGAGVERFFVHVDRRADMPVEWPSPGPKSPSMPPDPPLDVGCKGPSGQAVVVATRSC